MRYVQYLLLIFAVIAAVGCGGKNGDSSSSSSPNSSSDSSSDSSSNSSTASSSGSPLSKVCPDNERCAIMTLGDGIIEGPEAVGTSGYANNGGFRMPLLEMAVADGKSIVFVGARESGPASTVQPQALPRRHSGFSAIQLADLALMVPNPMKHYSADIVLLHAGTYDTMSKAPDGLSPASFSIPMQHLSSILQSLYALNPDGLIVVSNFAGVPRGDSRSAVMSAAIEEAVSAFQQQHPSAHIALADHFGKAISRGHDGFLPNAAGYRTIAEVWYQAIEQYLK